jgi:hypothetical protein
MSPSRSGLTGSTFPAPMVRWSDGPMVVMVALTASLEEEVEEVEWWFLLLLLLLLRPVSSSDEAAEDPGLDS